jgi:GGDEF domain-containing protein
MEGLHAPIDPDDVPRWTRHRAYDLAEDHRWAAGLGDIAAIFYFTHHHQVPKGQCDIVIGRIVGYRPAGKTDGLVDGQPLHEMEVVLADPDGRRIGDFCGSVVCTYTDWPAEPHHIDLCLYDPEDLRHVLDCVCTARSPDSRCVEHRAHVARCTGCAEDGDFFSEEARSARSARYRQLCERVEADPCTYMVEVNLSHLAQFNHDRGHKAGDALIKRWAVRVIASLDSDVEAVVHRGAVSAIAVGLEKARALRTQLLMWGNVAHGLPCWAVKS